MSDPILLKNARLAADGDHLVDIAIAQECIAAIGMGLAAEFGALSVDHFEYAEEEEVAAIAASDSVAALLPGAYYMLNETQKPPVAALRKANVPMALATDFNPGTSPLSSLLTTMNMGAVLFGLTVRECLDAVTLHAARALGRARRHRRHRPRRGRRSRDLGRRTSRPTCRPPRPPPSSHSYL